MPSEAHVPLSPAERSAVIGINLFRGLGGLLLAYFLLGTLASLTELQLKNPAAELRFASQMTDRVPMAFLGIVLLLIHPRFLRIKLEQLFLRGLTYLSLALAALYVLLIPITMNAGAQIFRYNAYQLEEKVKEQLDRAKKVQEATLNLPPEQQEVMVERYNRANVQKKPVTVTEFVKILNDEVKGQESRLEQERRAVLESQKRNLYAAQFLQSIQCLLAAFAYIMLWKWTGWARPTGQYNLRHEIGMGRPSKRYRPKDRQGLEEGSAEEAGEGEALT